ncbi:MAG: hypothetical protein KDC92_03560 [Bacteroidetes bacterium]|nr:hypothetical protein [Bacteroidota bacterium]
MSRKQEYQQRIQKLNSELLLISSNLNQIVVARLLLALAIIACLVLAYYLNYQLVFGALAFLFMALFGLKVKQHIKQKRLLNHKQTLKAINENELDCLAGNVSNNSSGKQFLQFDSANAYDLDLFGDGSLYQHIHRDSTPEGAQELANNLLHTLNHFDEITQRQQELLELHEKVEWRQNFLAIAQLNKPKKENEGSLNQWLLDKELFISQKSWLKPLLLVGPLVCIGAIVLYSFSFIPSSVPVAIGLLQLGFVGRKLKAINRFHFGLSKKQQVLERMASLLEHIEAGHFEHENLFNLQTKSNAAGKAIRQLKRRINLLDSRLNAMMAIVLNGVFLWDVRQVLAIEEWKAKHLADTEKWLDVIARMNAKILFANYVHNLPDFCWPKESTSLLIEAKDLAHPFIQAEKRISNHFELEPNGQMILLSGANMSGKSTFLRTVGLAMVKAQMGLPVCASSFSCMPLPVYTSMRINDSLLDSESYFYSELKRLKMVIDEIKSGKKMMVLLDEILRGTNSNDKHQGSIGLLDQLISLKTSGILASHDIALGSLAETYPNKLINKSFEVENENGELVFDYKLRSGVCQNLNASYLMKKMGITG